LTLIEAKDYVTRKLKSADVPDYLLESDLLLCKVLGCDRAWLLAHGDRQVFDHELEHLNALIDRRCRREPLAYIFGEAPFYGRTFLVGEGVLIPRQETEILVDMALSFAKEGVVLDWGTGSGCVILSLLLENPSLRGIALDLSPKAMRWAWRNVDRFGLFDRVVLWHESARLPNKWGDHGLDMIVSNPPYIPTADIGFLMPEVRLYEPRSALDGGPDGTQWYGFLFKNAPKWLKRGGLLLVEVGGRGREEAVLSMDHFGLVVHEVKRVNNSVSIVVFKNE